MILFSYMQLIFWALPSNLIQYHWNKLPKKCRYWHTWKQLCMQNLAWFCVNFKVLAKKWEQTSYLHLSLSYTANLQLQTIPLSLSPSLPLSHTHTHTHTHTRLRVILPNATESDDFENFVRASLPTALVVTDLLLIEKCKDNWCLNKLTNKYVINKKHGSKIKQVYSVLWKLH